MRRSLTGEERTLTLSSANYEKGFAAWHDELGMSDNPFAVGSQEYDDWYSGWVAAFTGEDKDV